MAQFGLRLFLWLTTLNRLSAPISSEERTRLLDCLATWDFKPHHLDDADLYRIACILFEGILNTEGVADLGIETGKSGLFGSEYSAKHEYRPNQPPPLCHPSNLPCPKPLPQLCPCHRCTSSHLLLPHHHRSRPTFLAPSRLDSGKSTLDPTRGDGETCLWAWDTASEGDFTAAGCAGDTDRCYGA